MNTFFFAIYLILGILFNAGNLMVMYVTYEHEGKLDLEYYLSGGYAVANLLIVIWGFFMVCLTPESLKDCAITTFYIMGIVSALVDLIFAYLFQNIIYKVFEVNYIQFYLTITIVHIAICLTRTITTLSFCLLAAKHLKKPPTYFYPQYLPVQRNSEDDEGKRLTIAPRFPYMVLPQYHY